LNLFLPENYTPNVWLVRLLIRLKILRRPSSEKTEAEFGRAALLNSFWWIVAQSLLGISLSFVFFNLFADVGLGRGVHNSYDHSDFMMQGRDILVNLGLLFACILGQFSFFCFIVSRSKKTELMLGPRFWILILLASVALLAVLTRQTLLGGEQYFGYIPNSQTFSVLVTLFSSLFFLGREIKR
jgi:hypothetical protein